MIPIRFGLFWSEEKMSYLRYLTFASLRKYHPNASIQLYLSTDSDKNPVKWNVETQDFLNKEIKTNYFEKLKDLNVEIIKTDLFNKYLPNFQSDFFRWWWLLEYGGFYLDTDQIIMNSFEKLNINFELIYAKYKISGNRDYYPVGVLGAQKGSDIVKYINDMIKKYYNRDSYNSIGPFFMESIMKAKGGNWWNRALATDYKTFYPVAESCNVSELYEGKIELNNKESICAHWFGGHPMSQKFNSIYDEDFRRKGSDSISKFLNSNNIL